MVFSRCSGPWDSRGMSSQDIRRHFSAPGHAVEASSGSDCLRPMVFENRVRHPVCEWANGEVGTPQHRMLALGLCW